MYRKSYCTGSSISFCSGGSVSKMFKFYINVFSSPEPKAPGELIVHSGSVVCPLLSVDPQFQICDQVLYGRLWEHGNE